MDGKVESDVVGLDVEICVFLLKGNTRFWTETFRNKRRGVVGSPNCFVYT